MRLPWLPQSLVDKIVFFSNLWRWRDSEEIKAGNSLAWWPKHIAELVERLDESEDLIVKVLCAELSSQSSCLHEYWVDGSTLR